MDIILVKEIKITENFIKKITKRRKKQLRTNIEKIQKEKKEVR